MSHQAILLPGIVLPAELAYASLSRRSARASRPAPRSSRSTRARSRPVATGSRPSWRDPARGRGRGRGLRALPPGRLLRRGRDLGRVRGSPRGAAAEPLPARAGLGRKRGPQRARAARAGGVRPHLGAAREELMRRFVALQLAPGVEPAPPPPGPTPPWMAKRPAGIKELTAAFAAHRLDLEALGTYPGPVYYALGGPQQSRLLRGQWRSGSADCSPTTPSTSSSSATTSTPRTGSSPSASRLGCAESGSGCRPRPAEGRRGWPPPARSRPPPSTPSRPRAGSGEPAPITASSRRSPRGRSSRLHPGPVQASCSQRSPSMSFGRSCCLYVRDGRCLDTRRRRKRSTPMVVVAGHITVDPSSASPTSRAA
jgi:hypothetical protein